MQKAKHCMFPPHSTIPICRVCFSAFALSTVIGEKINIQVSETEEVGVFAIVGLKSLCGLPTPQPTPSSEAISNLGPGDPQSQAIPGLLGRVPLWPFTLKDPHPQLWDTLGCPATQVCTEWDIPSEDPFLGSSSRSRCMAACPGPNSCFRLPLFLTCKKMESAGNGVLASCKQNFFFHLEFLTHNS